MNPIEFELLPQAYLTGTTVNVLATKAHTNYQYSHARDDTETPGAVCTAAWVVMPLTMDTSP